LLVYYVFVMKRGGFHMLTRIGAVGFALLLVAAVASADVQLRGTVVRVDKATNLLVVKTERGEEALLVSSGTKGIGNAKEGSKVVVKFTEKDGQPRVTEIIPEERQKKETAPP
jgi:hypothetical protein